MKRGVTLTREKEKELNRGRCWQQTRKRGIIMKNRGIGWRTTPRSREMSKMRGPGRALSSGGSSTTTACIHPTSRTARLAEDIDG
ncbi:hypothetical protein DPEC_G00160980 [Dallia pectoralis]|uniref:Uncharacterized protein n=1 Tax=Dallia pectoralis TaxID=75939 RepID=A0ACC2GFW9_DALPE|nr:hypothetical protein DPEC_G00160980 [Dallia pectoralis]